MDDLKIGLINCIVVKDVSGAGINYKKLGILLDETISDMGVRFFSIFDEYDFVYELRDITWNTLTACLCVKAFW